MSEALLWTEINLQAIAANVQSLKAHIGSACQLMAVVKADAYGHGLYPVARVALQNGATVLGVARLEEGLMLREKGIMAPILILGYTPARHSPDLVAHDLQQTICDLDHAERLSAAARARSGQPLPVHLKLDTGMARLGLPVGAPLQDESLAPVVKTARKIADLPGLRLNGLFTHFASADARDKSAAEAQLTTFLNFEQAWRAAGGPPVRRHAANSAAIMEMPRAHLDMVRAGIALYGLYPSPEVDRTQIALQPAMAFKTRIIQLKEVPAKVPVSYGGTYTTPRPTTLATVPVGYADGFNRLFSSSGHMLVAGQPVPVVGRVCMDLTVLDIGDLGKRVSVGEEVVIFGKQGAGQITVDDLAAQLNTINYEIVSTITERVPRHYLNHLPEAL